MHSSQTPKSFFLQIGIFATLYVSAISFLVFLFSVIDRVFPQAFDYYTDTSAIRFSISVLIVVFPLFILLGQAYRKFVAENPEYKDNKLRKWIIYFTLTVTGATMAGDAIILINSFLSGDDFALGFVLKVVSVALVAGSIFMFCLKDLKGYFDSNPKSSKVSAMIVSGVVLASVVAGFVLIGSPKHQRDVNYDLQRVNDLTSIQYQVVNHYQQKGVLPDSLKQIADPLSGNMVPRDPESSLDYGYSITGKFTFNLCADFKTDSVDATYMGDIENWKHDAKRTCFERTIDPEKYPLINSKIKN